MKARPTAIFIALIIAGCGGPGSPLLRTSATDGEGPLVPGCQNVSNAGRVEEYIIGAYLSTWGSASVEGGMEGFVEGVRDSAKMGNKVGEGIAGFMGIPGDSSEIVNHLSVPPPPYCRVYAANPHQVSRVVASILPMLGNPIRTLDETNGVFLTELTERQHWAARWRDSYEITVEGEALNRTIVRIWRKLYISRSRRVFNEAISVGHNEAWIMTQVGDKLNEPGHAQGKRFRRE